MRLAEIEHGGTIRLAMIDSKEVVHLFAGKEAKLQMSDVLADRDGALDRLVDANTSTIEGGTFRFRPPIARPGKIIAIGLNYIDHAHESDLPIPKEPLVFAKFPSSIIGHRQEIIWDPSRTSAVDYEGELGVIIGQSVSDVPEENALDYVFGYTCLNDVSARDLQFADQQWVRGKSLDTFCPLGPWIVTADEVPDPQRLRVRTAVNGETLQDAPTADMIWSVAALVSHLSRFFALVPGDVVATGTPPGVGWFREPRRLLNDGDEVSITITDIGTLTNRCRTTTSAAARK